MKRYEISCFLLQSLHVYILCLAFDFTRAKQVLLLIDKDNVYLMVAFLVPEIVMYITVMSVTILLQRYTSAFLEKLSNGKDKLNTVLSNGKKSGFKIGKVVKMVSVFDGKVVK